MMDGKDRIILKRLKKNARASWQELGEAAGISRVAARKRVMKLEAAGIIRGYYAYVCEPYEIRGFIEVETTEEAYEEMLYYASTRTVYVRQIFSLHKKNHFLMITVTPGLDDLRYMANAITRQDGVIKVTVNVAAEVIKDVYGGVRRYENEWEPQGSRDGNTDSSGDNGES